MAPAQVAVRARSEVGPNHNRCAQADRFRRLGASWSLRYRHAFPRSSGVFGHQSRGDGLAVFLDNDLPRTSTAAKHTYVVLGALRSKAVLQVSFR
jgi:hypothetical protein